MEDTPLNRLLTVLEEKLKKTPERLTAIKEIALNIKSTGMNVSDSALLSRVSDEELEQWTEKVPEIATLFRLRRLEFKQGLLRTINTQATTNGDVKMAQYLLEKNFSEEFDSTIKKEAMKTKPKEDEGDVYQRLADFVRSSAPPSPVSETTNVTADEGFGSKSNYDDADIFNGLEGIINHG